MKKIEMSLGERNIEPLFKVLGRNGVKEAVVNIFTTECEEYLMIEETKLEHEARIEFYCPDAALEALKKDIVGFSKNKWDTFRMEILALEEKINIVTKERINNRIKTRRMPCL